MSRLALCLVLQELSGGSGSLPGIDNSLPGQQPGGIWGGGNVPMPTPPIYVPSPIPGVPTHPIYNPPGVWVPVFPTHPIAPGGSQPGIDNTLPGGQPYPDQGLPGSQPRPDQGLPGNQPGIDNSLPGGQGGRPSHPIAGPHWVWSPVYGWVLDPSYGMGGKPGSGRPDNTLPGPQPGIDNTLPGSQPEVDNELPETAQPK